MSALPEMRGYPWLFLPSRAFPPAGHAPPGRRHWDFLTLLSLLLVGYAVGGKAFAYLGYSPVYVGEVVLALGTLGLVLRARSWLALKSGLVVPLLALLLWGVVRLAPDVAEHGAMALRDAAIWGYGWFAVLVYVNLVARPWRLTAISDRYVYFIRYGPVLMGAVWVLSTAYDFITVSPFGTRVPVLKGGELAVHAAGIVAFIYLQVRPVNPVLLIGPALLCVMGMNTRAGLLSVLSAAGFLLMIRPSGRKVAAVVGVLLVVMTVLAFLDFRFTMPGTRREISVDTAGQGLQSLFSDTGSLDLDGTKRWRLQWWKKIFSYTVDGEYFWEGKGFGVNLADEDGFTLESSHALRSPHNSHLTFLARGGVPGFLLWVFVQSFWCVGMLRTYFNAGRSRDHWWARMILFLLVYWLAYVVNASFDVCIEGPMAGIWFWTIYGAGLAVMKLHARLRAKAVWR